MMERLLSELPVNLAVSLQATPRDSATLAEDQQRYPSKFARSMPQSAIKRRARITFELRDARGR